MTWALLKRQVFHDQNCIQVSIRDRYCFVERICHHSCPLTITYARHPAILKISFNYFSAAHLNCSGKVCQLYCSLFKSPRSGVTLCFQFVSAASASAASAAAKKLFPLMSKPFELNLWYLAQRIYGSGEMYWMTFPWHWPKITAVVSISCGVD